MKSIFKKIVVCLCLMCMICIPLGMLTGCNKADNIQHNIRQDSDNFETYRRVTVINLRSDKVLLTVEGYISIKDSSTNEIAIINAANSAVLNISVIFANNIRIAKIIYLSAFL